MTDTERIDWLQTAMADGNVEMFAQQNGDDSHHVEIHNGRFTYSGATLRDAIDAAIVGDQPRNQRGR